MVHEDWSNETNAPVDHDFQSTFSWLNFSTIMFETYPNSIMRLTYWAGQALCISIIDLALGKYAYLRRLDGLLQRRHVCTSG